MFDGLVWHFTLRLILAAFLGGLIGLERSTGDRPAGLRTHVLVATGSALLMIVSIYGTDGFTAGRDSSRIASQVVSGIGFLGAGTILHEGLTVKGLTTAASLWVVSAIGLAVGSGLLWISVIATAMSLATLMLIRGLERKVLLTGRTVKCRVRLLMGKNPDGMTAVMDYLQARNIKTRIQDLRSNPADGGIQVDLLLKIAKDNNPNDIITGLKNTNAVQDILLRDE